MADPALPGIPWPTAPQPQQGGFLGGLLANPLIDALLKGELGGLRANDNSPAPAAPQAAPIGPQPVTSAPLPPPKGASAAPAYTAQDVSDDNPRGIDPAYVDRLKRFEGYRSLAYPDGAQYSVGWGTRASSPYERIDQDEAHRRLMREINSAAGQVDRMGVDMNPTQRHALIDLTYNAGAGWMNGPVGRAVRAGDWNAAASMVSGYKTTSHGRPFPGLVSRRGWEASGLRAVAAPASNAAPGTAASSGGGSPWDRAMKAADEPAAAPATAPPSAPAGSPWDRAMRAAEEGAPVVTAATGNPWDRAERAAETPSFADRWEPMSEVPPASHGLMGDARDAFWRTPIGLGIRAKLYGDPAARRYLDAMNAQPRHGVGGDASGLIDLGEGMRKAPGVTLGGAVTAAPGWALGVGAGATGAKALSYGWPLVRAALHHPVMTGLGGAEVLDRLGVTNINALGGMMDFYHGLRAMAQEARRRREEREGVE